MEKTALKRHERLSIALCEAVEYGTPTLIRMGEDDLDQFRSSFDGASFHKMLPRFDTFEGVPLKVERGFAGCVVEHDNRYSGPLTWDAGPMAVAETVVLMRDTKQPAIVAW